MGLKKLRSAIVLVAAAALTAATVVPGTAEEAPPAGVGTSSGSGTVLDVALGGDALVLRLLGEDSSTSNLTDSARATEKVTPLHLASTLLPALGGTSQPTVETSTTDGEDTKASPAVDLGSLLGAGALPGLLGGTIDPVALRSLVDQNGALSEASGGFRGLSVLGGLLSTGTAAANLGSHALVTDAGAQRSLKIDHLDVLDLTALLDALGLSLGDLPLDAAVGLLDGLGLPLPGGLSPQALLTTVDGLLDQTADVRAKVAPLQAQVDALQVQLAPLTSQLSTANALVSSLTSQLTAQQSLLATCGPLSVLCAPIQALITSLTGQLDAAKASVASIDGLIDTLQAQIDGLLAQVDALLDTVRGALDQLLGLVDGIIDGLDGASLLSVDDLVVGLTTRADDTLATSTATVVGSVGDVKVGATSLGALDPGAALGAVTGLAGQITGTLGGLLGAIDPSLANLVDVDLLDQTTSLTEADGATKAVAAITGLRAKVTPPDLCSVLGRLGVQDTLGSVLQGLGEPLAALPGPVGDLLGGLGSTITCPGAAASSSGTVSAMAVGDLVVGALTQPLTIEALSLSGTSSYSPVVPASPQAPATPGAPASPAGPTPTLPRTGGEAQLALAALGLGLAGLGTRRLLARAR